MSKKVEFNETTKEAFKNKAFVRKLLTLETGDQVRKALAEKNIVLTADELDKFAEILILALEKGQEMTDSDLEKVVGGKIDLGEYTLSSNQFKHDIGWNSLPKNSYFAKQKERLDLNMSK